MAGTAAAELCAPYARLASATGGGRTMSFPSLRRFCAIAASVNSNWAPQGPRKRSRPSRKIRLRCANSISTRLRSRRDRSNASVLASARATSRASRRGCAGSAQRRLWTALRLEEAAAANACLSSIEKCFPIIELFVPMDQTGLENRRLPRDLRERVRHPNCGRADRVSAAGLAPLLIGSSIARSTFAGSSVPTRCIDAPSPNCSRHDRLRIRQAAADHIRLRATRYQSRAAPAHSPRLRTTFGQGAMYKFQSALQAKVDVTSSGTPSP